MTGALVLALILSVAYAWRQRRAMRRAAIYAANTQARLVVARNDARQRAEAAEARANAADARLEVARQTMLTVAEAAAADASARPSMAYAPPVRAVPRAPVSVPAPACVACASRLVIETIAKGNRAPVFHVAEPCAEGEPSHAFIVRWGQA